MSDVPPKLFPEILCRVPAQPLLRFRSVCKTWRRIIDDPDFIKSHCHRHRCSTSGADQLLLTNGNVLHSLSLDSLSSSADGSHKKVFAIKRPQLISFGVPRLSSLPVASCDGIILLSHFQVDKAWTLWNPFSRVFLQLPPYDEVTEIPRGGKPVSGLGYDRATDDYKVVRLAEIFDLDDRSHNLETLIYSVKLGYWRRIEEFPDCYVPERCHGVFANGALHWMTYVKRGGKQMECIIALDLGTEVYKLLPLPPAISTRSEKNLDVLSGFLFVSCSYGIDRLEGWKMEKNCEGKSSWVKLFSCTSRQIGTMVCVKPVAYLKRRGLVLLQNNGEDFFWFDIEKNSADKVSMRGFPGTFSSQVCCPSLARLSECDGVDGGEGKRANKRLKLTLSTNVWDTDDSTDDRDY